MKIAVIGSGIAGLAAAHKLRPHGQVTVYEANDYFGGHTHTLDISVEGKCFPVDTGFLVFNQRTYPGLLALFRELGIEPTPSDMSFSVMAADAGMEWCGSSLGSVFAQRRNAFNPRFWLMLADLLRFNWLAQRHFKTLNAQREESLTVGDFLERYRFSKEFRHWYLLPMMACIWSCPVEQMFEFPLSTMLSFCHNHGLLQIINRPQWLTVPSGARRYVEKLVQQLPDVRLNEAVLSVRRRAEHGDVELRTHRGVSYFDHVVLATHSDQSLALLQDKSHLEELLLSAIRYQPNQAVLHTDSSVLPRHKRAWAAWNYERANRGDQESVCLHYLLNRLQPLPTNVPVIVSLNPLREIDPDKILRRMSYSHPVLDRGAIAAQSQLSRIQGQGNVWFCGAWTGYGFHEDGLQSGYAVANAILTRPSRPREPLTLSSEPMLDDQLLAHAGRDRPHAAASEQVHG